MLSISAGCRSGAPAAVRRVAAELGLACRDVGFFYVRNHDVSDALLSGIFKCSRAFFAAPRAEKNELAIKRSQHNRGYVGIATESLKPIRKRHSISVLIFRKRTRKWLPASHFAASISGRRH